MEAAVRQGAQWRNMEKLEGKKNAGHENWRFLGPNWFYDAQPKLGV